VAIALCVHVGAQARLPSLAGTWTLTTDASEAAAVATSGDRPRRSVEAIIVGLGIDSSRLRRVRDALRGGLDTPARLSITQTASMVIVTTSNGYTTRLSPGTRGIKDESTGIEMKTRWDKSSLVTEITGLADDKIVETYSTDTAHRLHVVVKLPMKRRAQPSDIYRIYETTDHR
jgi:hypothetical protein